MSDQSKKGDSEKPDSFTQVLESELELLGKLRAERKENPDDATSSQGSDAKKLTSDGTKTVYEDAVASNLAGLAFSGGGIRSATVNLGVIQALADDGALHKYDYLSTVSGGGYIGGWLSALIRRHHDEKGSPEAQDRATVDEPQRDSTLIGQDDIKQMQGRLRPHPADQEWLPGSGFTPVEDSAIRYLRRFSNFLTPRLGVSGDVLSAIAIVIRNITAMHLTLFLAIAVVAAVAQLFNTLIGCGLYQVQCAANSSGGLVPPSWGLIAAVVFAVLAGIVSGWGLSTADNKEPQDTSATGAVVLFVLCATMLSMLLLAVTLTYQARIVTDTPSLIWWVLTITPFYMVGCSLSMQYRQLIKDRSGAVFNGIASTAQYSDKHKWKRIAKRLLLPIRMGLVIIAVLVGVIKLMERLLRDVVSGQNWFSTEALEMLGWLTDNPLAFFALLAMLFGLPHAFYLVSLTRSGSAARSNAHDLPEYKYEPYWQMTAIVGSGVLLSWMLSKAFDLLQALPDDAVSSLGLLSVAFGPSALMIVFATAITVHIVLARRFLSHYEREYIVRLNGYMLALGVGWVVLFSIILFAVPTVDWLRTGGFAALITWFSASGAAAWLAKNSDGSADAKSSALKSAVIRIAPWIFALGAVIVSTYVFQTSVLAIFDVSAPSPIEGDFGDHVTKHLIKLESVTLTQALIALAFVGTLAIVMLRRLDVNLFSLHAMYCLRLERAFLGGTRGRHREANPFTGFSENDDIPMQRLDNQRPIHIVNTAINATGGDDLAWQTRRAASFSFTPKWAGFQTCNSRGVLLGGYRPMARYARGRHLGTWLAVSGAAASPNMGFHTSAGVAAMLTAYNLRLGRWCGNPTKKTWELGSPKLAYQPILSELSGSANLQSDWINLTDGGHFENLGVYELIRRRCRLVVVVDAGCDPQHRFDDLANMIRKCWVDFGVNVRMPDMQSLRLDKDGLCENHFAIGRIEYNTKNAKSAAGNGVLLYVKSSMTGSEWPDIRQYADAHDSFPHQTTADQFFDEDQFEAYRHLGFKMMRFLHLAIGTILQDGDPFEGRYEKSQNEARCPGQETMSTGGVTADPKDTTADKDTNGADGTTSAEVPGDANDKSDDKTDDDRQRLFDKTPVSKVIEKLFDYSRKQERLLKDNNDRPVLEERG